MLQIEKTDKVLGQQINQYLVEKGVQTPMKFYKSDNTIENISKAFKSIMTELQLNLKNDSLKETPMRVAKMFVNELFWGLKSENFPKCTTVENKMYYDEMILEKNIKVSSICEHHFVTIWGKAHIAYMPKNKVLGLSKLNRVVEYFAKRPQIQERLTEQIYWALSYILQTKNIAVIIDAEHFCVKTRGVEDINSNTITSKMGGRFINNSKLRHEFISLAMK